MTIKISNVRVEDSLMTVHVRGQIGATRVDHDLTTSMDGSYAEWVGDEQPIEIGSPLWDQVVEAMDVNKSVAKAVTKYNEG